MIRFPSVLVAGALAATIVLAAPAASAACRASANNAFSFDTRLKPVPGQVCRMTVEVFAGGTCGAPARWQVVLPCDQAGQTAISNNGRLISILLPAHEEPGSQRHPRHLGEREVRAREPPQADRAEPAARRGAHRLRRRQPAPEGGPNPHHSVRAGPQAHVLRRRLGAPGLSAKNASLRPVCPRPANVDSGERVRVRARRHRGPPHPPSLRLVRPLPLSGARRRSPSARASKFVGILQG